MINLLLKDGMGNQLFQYAAARALAEKLNTQLRIDISSFKYNPLREYSLHHFNIEERFVSPLDLFWFRSQLRLFSLFGKNNKYLRQIKFSQEGHHYFPLLDTVKDNTWIEGYWQSEKYFLSIEDIIRKEFVVKEPVNAYCAAVLDRINATNSVSLHVRRGDYVNDPAINALHGVCSISYYKKAISILKDKISNPVFFIFSDDMDWVKSHLPIDAAEVVYVDDADNKDYDDLRLMYSCKHNIIANSSFSWWGAWLNANPGKIVIAPKKWTQSGYYNPDLIPEKWITIDE